MSGAATSRYDTDYDLALQFAAETAKQDLEEIFKTADFDDDRLLSKDEMKALLTKFGVCTSTEIDKVMAIADTNNDGVVDAREFDAFVTDLRRSIHGRGEDPMDPASGCPHAL